MREIKSEKSNVNTAQADACLILVAARSTSRCRAPSADLKCPLQRPEFEAQLGTAKGLPLTPTVVLNQSQRAAPSRAGRAKAGSRKRAAAKLKAAKMDNPRAKR